MNDRIIALIGAFDENGTYGIGNFLPWAAANGRSMLQVDMKNFVDKTRSAPEGKQNVIVVGRGSFEAMGSRPLPGRRMIVLSQTLDEHIVNATLSPEKHIAVARNCSQAIDCAVAYHDCGNIFFGGGETVWLEALKSNLCNTAFITHIHCDTVAISIHKEGLVRRLPEMLKDETFVNMRQNTPNIHQDSIDGKPVSLEFVTYKKI
jgi:dihydrofolate reductase